MQFGDRHPVSESLPSSRSVFGKAAALLVRSVPSMNAIDRSQGPHLGLGIM